MASSKSAAGNRNAIRTGRAVGQAGWFIENRGVRLFITETGGHMAPVEFCRDTRAPVQPYYISPWQTEKRKPAVPVLVPLRGDFFCLPFGANADPYKGRQHTVHGEPGSARWRKLSAARNGAVATLELVMNTRLNPGKITKKVHLVDGQNVVYTSHVLEGYKGAWPLGHHATLALPEKEGSVKVSVGPFALGMTCPMLFGDPRNREYQSLAIGATLNDLARVPLLWKDPAYGDCSSFPQRYGYTDLLAVFKKPGPSPAWTAATFPDEGFLWFSLKDAAVLPSTVFWIANRGRHAPPWNGRNLCLGLEDVCGYFAAGAAASAAPNRIRDAGFATTVALSARKPTSVHYIQGVARIPAGFDRVKDVRFGPGAVTFVSAGGATAEAEVQHEFLRSGRLEG
jgi:hypothetical protein